MEAAALHCTVGAGIWEWASNDGAPDILPDVVLACAGDVPILETLAATSILRAELPDLRVRVVNVVDLMRLVPDSEHPHGLPDSQFNIPAHAYRSLCQRQRNLALPGLTETMLETA